MIRCPESPTGYVIHPADAKAIAERDFRAAQAQRIHAQRAEDALYREQQQQIEEEQAAATERERHRIAAQRITPPVSEAARSRRQQEAEEQREEERVAASISIYKRMSRRMQEDLLLSKFLPESSIIIALKRGGDRRRILKKAAAIILDEPWHGRDLIWLAERLQFLMAEEDDADELLKPEQKQKAEAVTASGMPVINLHLPGGEVVAAESKNNSIFRPVNIRPDDLWQRCTFDGTAYAGGIMLLLQGRVVLDLSTVRIASDPLPVYQQHSGSRVVGNARLSIDRQRNVIHLADGSFLDTPASREILSGFDPATGKSHPWQASIGTAKVARWERFKGLVHVNGKQFRDVVVARGATIEECSFVGQGADLSRPSLTVRWRDQNEQR